MEGRLLLETVCMHSSEILPKKKNKEAGRKINFLFASHLAPKYFKVVANSKKLVAIMTQKKTR